jgi:hypothetical protein
MKQMFVALMAVLLLVRCGKEKELKAHEEELKEMTEMLKDGPVKPIGTDMESDTSPVNSLYPCNYYPPGSPFSCTPNEGGEPTIPYPTILYQNGYLKFASVNDFTKTYDMLDSLVENFTGYDFAMNLFGGDMDKIDSLLDLRGVDETKPMVDFEAKFTGFVSLRKDVEKQETTFLDNGGDPSSANNPENLYFINDDVFRTMLNKEGVISVENILFKVFPNGVTYVVLNGSATLLSRLSHPEATNPSLYPEYYGSHLCTIDTANIKLLDAKFFCENRQTEALPGNIDVCSGTGRYSMGADCKLGYRKTSSVFYDNRSRLYTSTIGVYNAFFFDAGSSKIRNYKIKRNGRWKSTRTLLSAYVSESGCSEYNKLKALKYRRFRRCVKRDVTVIPFIGSLFRGLRWMAQNIKASSSGDDYYRYFKTATNHSFFGRNYCNYTQHYVQADW